MSHQPFDLIVVGAGIIGLACAYHAARAGRRVALLERSPRAVGGSIRNFGMVWPVGRPGGADRERALRTRGHWLELSRSAGVELRQCGSIHLARTEPEEAVLREFAELDDNAELDLELLDPAEACRRSPIVRREGLRCAMHCPTECAVNPPQAIAAIAAYLRDGLAVDVRFSTAAVRAEPGVVITGAGERVEGERIIICSGPDFATLFPEACARLPMTRCDLQMMRVRAVDGRALAPGPHLAGGLTLLHYPSFEACSALPRVREHAAAHRASWLEHGIHVLAAHAPQGELIVGDSHAYGCDGGEFRSERVDRLILEYLAEMIDLEFEVTSRWIGTYAKRDDGGLFCSERVADGIELLNGFGGMGMTLGLGAAEEVVAQGAIGLRARDPAGPVSWDR